MFGACHCVDPHSPCSACGAGMGQGNMVWPGVPLPYVVRPAPPAPVVTLEDLIRRIIREELAAALAERDGTD